jgi:hypothetical protein
LDGLGFKGYEDSDQIMDLVKTYIDYDKIFERELLKKLEDFYGALGWGEVLSSQKTAEKFFSF